MILNKKWVKALSFSANEKTSALSDINNFLESPIQNKQGDTHEKRDRAEVILLPGLSHSYYLKLYVALIRAVTSTLSYLICVGALRGATPVSASPRSIPSLVPAAS